MASCEIGDCVDQGEVGTLKYRVWYRGGVGQGGVGKGVYDWEIEVESHGQTVASIMLAGKDFSVAPRVVEALNRKAS